MSSSATLPIARQALRRAGHQTGQHGQARGGGQTLGAGAVLQQGGQHHVAAGTGGRLAAVAAQVVSLVVGGAAGFVIALVLLLALPIAPGQVVLESYPWVPSLGVELGPELPGEAVTPDPGAPDAEPTSDLASTDPGAEVAPDAASPRPAPGPPPPWGVENVLWRFM